MSAVRLSSILELKKYIPILGLRSLSVFLLFLANLLLARIASSAAEFGSFLLWLTCLNILVILLKFGVDTGAIRFVSAYKTIHKCSVIAAYRDYSLKKIIKNSFFAAMLLVIYYFSGYEFFDSFSSVYCIYLALAGFLLAHSQYRRGELIGAGLPKLSEAGESLLRPVSLIAVAAYFLSEGPPLNAVDLIQVLTVILLVTSLVMFLVANFFLPLKNVMPRDPLKNELAEWSRSTRGMATNVFVRQVIKSADILFCALFLSPEEVAFYAVASRLADVVVFALTSLNLIFAPTISGLYAEGKKDALNLYLRNTSRLVFFIGGFMFLLIFFCGENLLGLYGEEYTESYYALLILAFGQLINSFFGSSGYVASMTGHQGELTKALMISAVISCFLYIVLLPMMGILGAAIASMSGTVCWNVVVSNRMTSVENLKSRAF
ncbi:MAG: polysaccharide biosynthesis C-terminal domain-containing protein [Pseudomonadales bacterium]|nr:polysaccharide biosynthesis C-terminal domain-containing protein [Pseudomonadales bacterium]